MSPSRAPLRNAAVVSAVVLSLVAPGCGGGGRGLGELALRAAAGVAAAVVASAVEKRVQRRRGRRRNDTGEWVEEPGRLETDGNFEASELAMMTGRRGEPLPMAEGVELDPGEISCEADRECVRVAADCCSCAAGGVAVAVHIDEADAVSARLCATGGECVTGTAGGDAPERASCTGEVRCHFGLCRIMPPPDADNAPDEDVLDEEDVDALPPVPEPDAPLEVPEGY